jgi:predicted deacylase
VIRHALRSSSIVAAFLLFAVAASHTAAGARSAATDSRDFTIDGRKTERELMDSFNALSARHGWQSDTIYTYPDQSGLAIKAWHTPHRGEALWIVSGIHGEEPAGPNAIARSVPAIVALGQSGIPVVVIPLCNPKAYRNNWRYPNTAERDWRKGGYSVGDAEHLLPDLETGSGPRAMAAPGPETHALTSYVLQLAKAYPPRLVLDLHEDELSTEGGYIYSQGSQAADSAVGKQIVRLLQDAGIPIRQSGMTRFGEPI